MAFSPRSAGRPAGYGARATSATASVILGSRSGPGCTPVRSSTGRTRSPGSPFTWVRGSRRGRLRVRFSSPTSSGPLCSAPAFRSRTGAPIRSGECRAPGSCSRRFDAGSACRGARAGSQAPGEPADQAGSGRVHKAGVVVQVDVVGGIEPEELFVGRLGTLVDGVGGAGRAEVVAAAVDEQGGGAREKVGPDRGVEREQLADRQAGDPVRPAGRRRPLGPVVVPGFAPGHGRRAVAGVDGRD